jgi:PAS domain S-box-containing protein
MRILVVEDERHVAEAVKQLLADRNYAVDIASDGAAGLAMTEAYAYDLIVLDIGLPQLDGVEVCKRLRDCHFKSPILLLTGRTGSENKAIALNAGADDYVVKPFDAVELVARVQALLRRPAHVSQPLLTWGDLTFDPNTRQVSYGDRLLKLTPKEYAIVELLLRNPRSPLSSKAILERVWTADECPAEEVVRGHIKELRHKFVAVDAPKDLIKTVHRVGYRFNPLHASVGAERSSILQVAELAAVNEELRGALERLRSTQDTLKASEERYRLLSDISPVGIFRNGVDGHCTYLNEKAAQLVGYPPAECLGLNWVNTLHPDDRQWVYAGWQSFLARSVSGATATHRFECRHLHPHGEIVWVLVHAVPERDAEGTLTGYIGTLTDITERHQAEEKLRRAAAMDAFRVELLATLRSIADPIEIQAQACRLLGEHLGVDRAYYVEVNHLAQYARIEQNYLRGDSPSIVGVFRLVDYGWILPYLQRGETVVVADVDSSKLIPAAERPAMAAERMSAQICFPIIKSGALMGALCVTEPMPRQWSEIEVSLVGETAEQIWANIERVRAETALRESEAKYRTLFDSIDEGFATIEVIFDETDQPIDFRYVEVNPVFERQTAVADITGRTILDLVPDLDRSIIKRYGRVATEGEPARFEMCVAALENEWFSVYAARIGGEGSRQVAVVFNNITAHKRAEIGTQTNLEIAIESAQMGTWYLDVKRDVSTVRSLRHDRIFGYDTLQSEWGQEIARLHVVAADREIFDAAFAQAMVTGKLDFEVRVQWSDGSIHWMAARGRFDFDLEGNVTHGCGVNFDITERKQAEAELQAQQRLLEQVTESTTAILYIYDLVESRSIYVNAQVETILGYTPAAIQAMGANLLDLVHPNDLPTLLAALERCAGAADGEIVEYEYRMRDINGEWHWLQSRDRVLARMADGAVKQKLGTAIDITARKQSAQTIDEQAALLDFATDAIFVRDLDHRILYWNQGAERVYGWSAAEALGQKANELLGEPADLLAEVIRSLLARGQWQGDELHKFGKSGRELTVEGRWTLVRDEFGQPKSILAINTDITEKRQLQAQFYQAQRLESLGTLASGIAHDLNNILTPILAFAQILRWQLGLDAKTQARLQIIEDNARRGADMVEQILTFARGASGKYIALQVDRLLQDVAKVAQQTFPKSIVIDRHLPDDLWLVAGDATQLHQVFLNLCVNARDAMPNGGRLRITAENHAVDKLFARLNINMCAGNYVLVTIADTGTGIPSDILDRIFDPFFTTKPIGEGTGLGLSTVLGLVDNHGGFVRVASTPGQGTEFKIYLPTAEGEEKAIATDFESVLPTGNGELILIVDDDPAVREANRSLLEDHNYQTLIASDGIEAMGIYAQQMQSIDLVLIDAMMPHASGATAIRTICWMNPQAKILAISGLSSNRESSIDAGAQAFLTKPYQLATLLKTVSQLLDLTEGRGE